MKVYLDACCLNRPFDDQTQVRIHLEAEAVLTILNNCEVAGWLLINSEVVNFEISKIPDVEKRKKVSIFSSIVYSSVGIDKRIEKRAIELETLKFNSFDALHIACAEMSKVDVMLTTDDDLLGKALQNKNVLRVRVENPVRWLMEVIKNEGSHNDSEAD